MGWSTDPAESFRLFQSRVLDEYDRLVEEFGLTVVDAVASIASQQRVVRQHVSACLEQEHAERATAAGD